MEMQYKEMSKKTKATILVSCMSKKLVKEITKELDGLEKKVLKTEIEKMEYCPKKEVEPVVMEFIDFFKEKKYKIDNNGYEYAINVLKENVKKDGKGLKKEYEEVIEKNKRQTVEYIKKLINKE